MCECIRSVHRFRFSAPGMGIRKCVRRWLHSELRRKAIGCGYNENKKHQQKKNNKNIWFMHHSCRPHAQSLSISAFTISSSYSIGSSFITRSPMPSASSTADSLTGAAAAVAATVATTRRRRVRLPAATAGGACLHISSRPPLGMPDLTFSRMRLTNCVEVPAIDSSARGNETHEHTTHHDRIASNMPLTG